MSRLEDLPPAPAIPAAVAGEPGLHGAWFRYGPELPWVVRGVDLTIPAGRRVAITGASGEGKTTLALLLAGFVAPERGHVTGAARPGVCLCAQDAHVFDASLLDNVRVARPNAGEHDVEAALGAVGLLDWARGLQAGLRTRAGDAGGLLSGGQRQRLAVARSLLADTHTVILDEPSAQLDGGTAAAMLDQVLAALAGRSVVLITHRPEGLERMDEVYEMVEGRLLRTA